MAGFAITAFDAEEELGSKVGFVNRRSKGKISSDRSFGEASERSFGDASEIDIFTFQNLRKRTSFMKAKAAGMHSRGGAVPVDNTLDSRDTAIGGLVPASEGLNRQHGLPLPALNAAARCDVPVEDEGLEVLREGWLLKRSKTLKLWHKKYCVLDSVALYWAKSPHDIPDGFYPIRKCQFLLHAESGMFELIASGHDPFKLQVLRHKTEEALKDLEGLLFRIPYGTTLSLSRHIRNNRHCYEQLLHAWARSYKKAMSNTYFPYFHVVQLGRKDMSQELLLGVCKRGLRLVKLGLYDPGREDEIAFYCFSEIYEWGCPDLETFVFCATSERQPYVFKTMHARDIEDMSQVKFARWTVARKKNPQGDPFARAMVSEL